MRAFDLLARLCALFAGLVMMAVALATCGSIVSRQFFGAALLGDFELVQVGMAFAVAAFMPLCQIRRGNIIVDFFTARVPPRGQAALDALGALLLAVVLALVAWRAGVGAQGVLASGERAMISRVPVWIPYAGIVPSLAFASVVGFYTAWESLSASMKKE